MSLRRDLVAKVFPRGLPFSELLQNNASFVALRRERFSHCPEFPDRDSLYRHLADKIGQQPIDYLEFGVWKGDSISRWLALNSHPNSRFVGFDTFEGLPEAWIKGHPAGTFSTQGVVPKIDDPRLSFVKGLFQNTLRGFLGMMDLRNRLVINIDCDLYSATLYVLGTLDKYFVPGTVLIFDDFYSLDHEFKAFVDYNRSFGRRWLPVGRLPYCIKTAIEIQS